MALPQIGEVVDGYRYKGGDPNDQNSWEQSAESPVQALPNVGDMVDGYRYKGGNPNDQASWEGSSDATEAMFPVIPGARAVGSVIGHKPTGVAEAALTLGSGAVSQVAGGLAGVGAGVYEAGKAALEGQTADQALQAGVNAGADMSRSVSEAGTYTPRTDEGKAILRGVGTVAGPVSRVLNRTGQLLTEGGAIAGRAGAIPFFPTLRGDVGERVGAGLGALSLPAMMLLAGGGEKPDMVRNGLAEMERVPLPSIRGVSTSGYSPAQRALYNIMDQYESEQVGAPATAAAGAAAPPGMYIATPDEYVGAVRDVATALSKGKTAEAAKLAEIDPELVALEQRLGMQPDATVASRNVAFKEVMAELKAQNPLMVQKDAYNIARIQTVADQLIRETGGNIDRSVFDAKLKMQYDVMIPALKDGESQFYDLVRKKIPAGTQIDPAASRAFVQNEIDDLLGRTDQLKPIDKSLWDLVNPDKGAVSYHALDEFRKEIGRGFDGRSGAFKDAARRDLTRVYDVLGKDQHTAAAAYGVDDALTAAQSMSVQRFALQKNAVKLLGRELEKGINPKIVLAANNLIKGDTAALDALLNTVPDNLRQEAAGQVLGAVMSSGGRSGATTPAFGTSFAQLSRNQGAMDKLLSELSPEAGARFKDLGLYSQKLQQALSYNNHSRTAHSVYAMLNDPTVIGKIWSAAKPAAESIPLLGHTAEKLGEAYRIFNPKLTPAQASDRLINSAKFQDALASAVATDDVAAANATIKMLPEFRAWATTLDAGDVQTIGKLGFIGWLTNPQAGAGGDTNAITATGKTRQDPFLPKTKADFDALPANSYYRDPDNGRLFIKPASAR